jgi:hypothetical protein
MSRRKNAPICCGLPLVARPPEELDLVRIQEHVDEREPNAVDLEVVSADAGDGDFAAND